MSKEQYLTFRRILNAQEQYNVITAAADHFFTGKEPNLEGRFERVFYDALVRFAEEKENAWERQRSNFTRNNPRKAKKQDPDL